MVLTLWHLSLSQSAPHTMPSPAERLTILKKKQAALEQQANALRNALAQDERKRDTRRKIIIGAAVLAHAAKDPDFAARLQMALDHATTRAKDRVVIADLLPPSEPPVNAATPPDDDLMKDIFSALISDHQQSA